MTDISVIRPLRWSFWWRIYPSCGTQRVKQTWHRIFFVWNHIEKAQTNPTRAQLPLCWTATAKFFLWLLSSGSDSVLYSKFLCHVSGSSSRIAQCSTSPALLPWRRPVEAKHVVSLGCSLCGGLFIAHSSWSLGRENARNNETKTSSSYFDVEWFPCSLVRGRYPRPSIDVCTIGNSPILHTTLAQPHYLFNYESVSCRKVAKTF